MSEEKKEITAEQYINLAKIDSLAKQNAQQAVRIADLEAQIGLYQAQQQQAQQPADEPIPGEEFVFEEVDEAH
jgi:hypothetical protein